MKISKIDDVKIIIDNPYNKHNDFAWPTVVRLQD